MARPICVVAALIVSVGSLPTSMRGQELSREDESPAGVELTGRVLDVDSKPVVGASVLVWTAGVKRGYSTFCPSCYADCGKRATTNADGGFALHRLSPDLRFRLLVVCEGFAPTFVDKVDPVEGAVAATLPRRDSPADLKQVVRGRIVEPTGEPIRDAVVESEMVHFYNDDGQLGGIGGAVKGLDPVALSNDGGEFEIAYTRPAVKMTLMVKARGHAPKRFADLSTGGNRHDLTISTGATVRGRLVHRGRPVPGAEMGLASKDRSMSGYYSEERIGTGRDGTFLFTNVPAPGKWYAYAKMASIVQQGATQALECATARDEQIVNLGDVEIKPGHRLSGQVVLTDGKEIPEGMRIALGADRAWDGQIVPLPADGKFEFVSIPTDNYTISPSVKGYRLSGKNPNLSWTIEGVINRDVEDFVILLEPGQENFQGRYAGKFKGQPLRSAEKQ